MSWINDLAGAIGIPAGAATLAVAMYAACTAAEKAASTDALNDIGRILRDSSWEKSVRASAAIDKLFNWTFGERQLSLKCVYRTIIATAVVALASTLLLMPDRLEDFSSFGEYHDPALRPLMMIMMFAVWGFFVDYPALAKTRILLKIFRRLDGIVASVSFLIADIALSLVAILMINIAMVDVDPHNPASGTLANFEIASGIFLYKLGHIFTHSDMEIDQAFYLSTLLTSIWTGLVIISAIVLKMAAPIQRFTGWFFDVEKHPLQALGIVAGALVMLGSAIWSAVRAII